MDIFVNSTFAQSVRGFRLMRMCDDGFADITATDEMPAPIYDFFREDLFRVIWCEVSAEKELFAPVPTGSYFGIKGLNGVFDNQKKGIIDIAFYADADEIFMLADMANKILCRYSSFSDGIFRSFHIDSAGNYSVSKQGFLEIFEQLEAGEFPRFVANTNFSYHTARNLLHLAVCTGSQERALRRLPGRWLGFRRPTCVIDEEEFNTYLCK